MRVVCEPRSLKTRLPPDIGTPCQGNHLEGNETLLAMVFLHLFIVNKSGGLIHHRSLSPKAPTIGTNEWLRIGSTFHSLHAIAAEASPLRMPGNRNTCECLFVHSRVALCQTVTNIHALNECVYLDGADDGIEQIDAGGLILRCFQTRTGVKFVVTAEPGTPDLDFFLREIYVLYADCALKDPFYELEMPIRCELFTQAVNLLMERLDKGIGGSRR